MRCEEVARQLAAPRSPGHPAPAGLAEHLASCPRCADWSRLTSRLDRAWEATRPAPPSAEALDTLWARASSAIDAAPKGKKSAVIPFEAPARRRRWGAVAFVGAQAAALLLAALFLLRSGPAPAPFVVQVPGPTPAPAKVAGPVLVGVDQTVIVRIVQDGHEVDVLDDSAQFAFSMADSTPHDVFSAVESMVNK